MQKDRYNFSKDFRNHYDKVSFKARRAELISTDLPHHALPSDSNRAPQAAVPTYSTKFIAREITKTGGRTHAYLEEFYGSRNQEMAELMHSAIYPGAGQMDMN